MIKFKPTGVCARQIEFEVEDNKLKNVSFEGGCNGNLKAISKLVDGMDINQVIGTLKGNTCGHRSTSCTDQLTKALEQYIEENKAI